MSGSGVAESFENSATASSARPLGIYGISLGLASAGCGLVLLPCALIGLGDTPGDSALMLVVAGVLGGHAALQARRPFDSSMLRPVPTLAAGTLAYLFVAIVSSLVYLGTGSFDRIDDALYESVAGVSTSSLTMLDDPGRLSNGVLAWRSGTQWIGGLGALALSVAILPFLGGSRELADPRERGTRRLALAPRPAPALRRVLALYTTVSVLVTGALWGVGMSLFDAFAHMMSSVSTGGFSTHVDSIAHYESRLVTVTMIVVMAGAGFSLALVWMLLRGLTDDARRAFELRVYAAVLSVASLAVFALRGGSGSVADRAIEAVFTTVSLSTTTGHHVADWGSWQPGAAFILVLLLVVGGMSGSVAGGLRWFRVIGLVQFVWRELQRQLHPRAVRSVKVGHTSISEASIDRWHSQLVLTVFVGGTGAIVLAFFGSDILEALTLAFSAVSTTGPAISDDGGTLQTAASLSRADRAALMPLMIMGRVAIYPAFVLVGVCWFGGVRQLDALRHGVRRRSAVGRS